MINTTLYSNKRQPFYRLLIFYQDNKNQKQAMSESLWQLIIRILPCRNRRVCLFFIFCRLGLLQIGLTLIFRTTTQEYCNTKKGIFLFLKGEIDLQHNLEFGFDEFLKSCFYLYETFQCGLANEAFFNYYISFHDQSSQSVQIEISPLIYDQYIERFQRLLITVTKQTPILIFISANTSSLGVSHEMDQNLVIVYVLVSIAILLLVAWIIIILIRFRKSSRVHEETNTIPNSQINSNNNYNKRRNKSSLNLNLLDQYMPKLLYSQILEFPKCQELEVQEACLVCLLEYQKNAICRLTPCHHIFHSDCLYQWVMKYENCPLCRTALDQKSLKELYNKNLNHTFNLYKQKDKQPNQNVVLQSQLFSNAQTELRMIAHNSSDNQ
ncbi:unnamed protein product (macronuclear) [Paramecium tetraurelia]|uniref:RING-type domain-containing protein n=1 Tax=Paramecium tetraurelia TaxID=5888 RepID=A0E064_PARTE|nr:uncharacterized protein GSPATT00021849001 [Paramecium tetraurelia]CAK88681.1 unnamed protein product [Paramecium tetraurelia]|eukprot:XP_001456078.1 hypothetical protein (macronuclear) [Paramecium tetraurelia strain d4-2]